MSLRASWVLLLAFGCGSCGGAQERTEPELPEALADLPENAEVTPFGGWSAEGLTLYRVSWAVPDLSVSKVVGVDGSGQRVEGAALMRRFGDLEPGELATRAFAVLLGKQGAEPLTPEDRASLSFGTDAEWAVIEPARRVGSTLSFFALQGEMAPELVEHRLDLETFELTTRPVTEVVLEGGGSVPLGDPRCVPWGSCGCWRGCARVQAIRGPADDTPVQRVVAGELEGTELVRRESCYEGTCFQVCAADSPTADCQPGIHEAAGETCTGACAPSEAPFHCETLADGCRRVDHPVRGAAR